MKPSRTSMISVLSMAFLLGAAHLAVAQQGDQEGSDRSRGDSNRRRGGFDGRRGGDSRGDRGSFGDRRGGDRGSFFRRPPTPEEREEMYDRMTERYLENFEEDYALSDAQAKQVETELAKIKTEHKAYIEPLQDELTELFQKMREGFDARREGGEWDSEAMRETWQRMAEIRSGSPLMSFDTVRERVEGMLPDAQVDAGRKRQEERRERMREFWSRRGDRDGDSDRGRGDWVRDPWERYYNQFLEVYTLDDSQKTSAGAIFRDYVGRRDAYRESKKDAFAQIENVEDRDARREQWRQLNAPIDQMYDEFRAKLDQIPTAAQKELAQAERAATSRPAGERDASRRDRGRDRERSNREGDNPRRERDSGDPDSNTPQRSRETRSRGA